MSVLFLVGVFSFLITKWDFSMGKLFKKSDFFSEVKADLKANGSSGKISTGLRLLLLDQGIQLLFCYRLQYRLHRQSFIGRSLARVISYWAQVITGSQISSTARLEGGIVIPHANGIVIGRDVVMKTGTSIYQQVTLGADKMGLFPTVLEKVTIYPGAKVIGSVCLGANSTIGANSVVIRDVAAGDIVAGVPARVIQKFEMDK